MGKKFKAKLSFTDDDGNAESRTSAVYPAAQAAPIVANTAPTGADETVTLAEDGSYAFKAADFGFADSDTGDALASVKIMTLPAPGKGTLALDGTTASTDQVIAAADLGKLTFEPAANGHGDPYATFTFKVSDGTTESASAYTMTVDVTAVNDVATGAPAISGTARKGLTLIASKSTVADADGLTKAEGGEAGHAYSWHWLRVDGATERANLGGDVQDLHPGGGGRGQEGEGSGDLQRRRRQRGEPHQRGLSVGRRWGIRTRRPGRTRR